jgi:predicted permease
VSYLDYRDLDRVPGLSGVAGESGLTLIHGEGETAELASVRLVSANYFALLGARPALGDFFNAEPAGGPVPVVIGHGFWRARLGARGDVVGRQIRLGNSQYVVSGVAPAGFTGASLGSVDAFLPLEAASHEQVSGTWRTNRGLAWIGAVVRLAAGARADAVEAAASAVLTSARVADPEVASLRAELRAVSLAEDGRGDVRVAMLVIGVSALVFLVAIANVMNLFVARSLRRGDETRVRLALGASRSRVIAEHALEGAVLGTVGAALAVAIAKGIGPRLPALLFPNIDWTSAIAGTSTMAPLGAIAVLATAVAAGLPAWHATQPGAAASAPAGARFSRRRTRTQTALLMVQGALSVVLLVGAGLFVSSLLRVSALELGLDLDRVLVVGFAGGDSSRRAELIQDLRSRLAHVSGVDGTALAVGTLPFVASAAVPLALPGVSSRPRVADGGPYLSGVSPDYFRTAGTRIIAGRAFTDDDGAAAPPVAVVNQTMARLFWPGEPAIGQCVWIGETSPVCTRVVGVAANSRRQEVIEGDSLLYYVPLAQAPEGLGQSAPRLIVRTASAALEDRSAVAESIRRLALSADPSLRLVRVRPLDALVAPQLRVWHLGASLFSLFGLLALVIAGIGVYSVVAFDLEGRKREIGVRLALGAAPRGIVMHVVAHGLRLALVGIAAGIALAWTLAPQASALLFETGPRDPVVLVLAPCLLALAAALASLGPARRARRTDPAAVLREG